MNAFNQISESLLKAKKDVVEDLTSVVLLSSALVNKLKIADIDFDQLVISEIIHMRDNLFEIVSEEDDEGYVLLDPEHPYSRIDSIQLKMHALETSPKQRVPSSFRFL